MGMKTTFTSGILTSLPGRYAKALFDLAQEERQVQRIGSSLRAFKKLIHTSKDLEQALANPTISREERETALNDLCIQMNAPEIFQSFLGRLVKAGRTPYLPKIEEIYQSLVSQAKKEQVVEVISAYPLTPAQSALLKDKLKKVFPGIISFIFVNDPKVLGGIMIRVGSRVIDATLVSQLNKLATVMKGST
jgi:F-type H+-transporting ATPase subunit delta